MKFFVPAKINTSLAVIGKRGDLHTLEMEVCSVNLYDEVEVREGCGKIYLQSPHSQFVAERFLPTVQKCIDKYCHRYSHADVDVFITKNIPPCAGMGGSSASLVGVLKGLSALQNTRIDDEFLLEIGADMPYMYRGGSAIVRGVGEEIESVPFAKRYFVVVVADGGVDSGQAYATFDKIGGELPNMLERSAVALNPNVLTAKEQLLSAGATRVVMSGSGSAMVCVCESETEAKGVHERLDTQFSAFLLESVQN